MTTTAHTDLTHIATHWATLRELLEAQTPTTWPPAARMTDHQRNLATPDDETLLTDQAAAAEWAERTAVAPGVRPAPLRVTILDIVTAIEDDLVALADEIAGAVQRPAFTVRSASPDDLVARSVALMGAKDASDPSRWRFNMTRRDAPLAAQWLAARLLGPTGPHRALTLAEEKRIASVARRARRRLDRALGEYDPDEETETRLECPCGGGLLTVTPGTEDFTVSCRKCGISWTGTALLNKLRSAA